MTAKQNTTLVNPSILSSTMKGHKCSEVFLLNSDTTTGQDTQATTILAGDTASDGQFHVVRSDGWSELQLWMVGSIADGAASGTHTVIGKRHFVSESFPTGNISSNVYKAITALNAWFSCPVLSSTTINPGTDSNATTPVSPPMGCHQSGSMVTWDSHAGGVLDVSDTSVLLNGTSRIFGGVTVDVRGTKEITVVTGEATVTTASNGAYILGQFIA